MTTGRITRFARRRAVRATAVTALVLAPLATVPVLMVTGAVAADGGGTADCAKPQAAVQTTAFDAAGGTATFYLKSAYASCAGTAVSLAAYYPSGPGATFPQQLVSTTHATLTTVDQRVTLSIPVPAGCHLQVDLVTGDSVPEVLHHPTFTDRFLDGALIDGKDCYTPPSTTSSAPPTTTSSEPPTTTSSAPPTTTSSEPPTTTSSAPPTTTSSEPPTTTSSAPPTSTCTPPPTTTSGAPTSTSTAPPSTSSAPPTSCSTPPTTTTSEPPPTTTSVLPTVTTSEPPTTSAPPPVTTTSSLPASVLPFVTTRAPDGDAAAGTLPYTGSALPVRDALLTALALLFVGAALILAAGRPRGRQH